MSLPENNLPPQKPSTPERHEHKNPLDHCNHCVKSSYFKIALGTLLVIAALLFIAEAYMRYQGSSLATSFRKQDQALPQTSITDVTTRPANEKEA